MSRQENLLYAAVWAIVFLTAPLVLYFHVLSRHDSSFDWGGLLALWASMLPYLLLFVLHNFLAVPFLLKKNVWAYAVITAVLLTAFGIYCFSSAPRPPEMFAGGPPPLPGEDRAAPPGGMRPMEPEVMEFIIAILVLLVNLGVKAVFINFGNTLRIKEMQQQSLSLQLETLRYQISPHFFMNTLNNIHALVDIDQEKAKESIEEFSKLMRIVLYDGNAPTIPLQKEVEFLRHYVALMRIRYPEDVDIELHLPETLPPFQVPPLVMATFAENAFKHGISYEATSFVHIKVAMEGDKVLFKCANSRHSAFQPQRHGLGLENIRERLGLIYGGDYTLHVEEGDKVYEIIMLLPAL